MSRAGSDVQTTERDSLQRWMLGAIVFAVAFVIAALGAGSDLRSDLHRGNGLAFAIDFGVAGIVPAMLAGFSVRWLKRRQDWKRAVAFEEAQRNP